jgi:hypothetical protein
MYTGHLMACYDALHGNVAEPGYLSRIRIPDPNFSIPDPGYRVKKIPDP